MADKIGMKVKPGISTEQYDQLASAVRERVGDAPAGGIFHSAVLKDGQLVIIDAWEDQASLDSFRDEVLGPIVEGAGVGLAEPKTFPIHNVYAADAPDAAQIGVMFHFAGGSTDQYDQVMEDVFGGLDMSVDAPDGLVTHLAAQTEDGLFIFDTWASQEDFAHFGQERLMPAVQKSGLEAEPKFVELHELQIGSKTTAGALA